MDYADLDLDLTISLPSNPMVVDSGYESSSAPALSSSIRVSLGSEPRGPQEMGDASGSTSPPPSTPAASVSRPSLDAVARAPVNAGTPVARPPYDSNFPPIAGPAAPGAATVNPPTGSPEAAPDTRPTMAELLDRQEHLRRDKAVVDATRKRVETPKPLAVDMEAIERQYAEGSSWDTIVSMMDKARPYQLPTAKYNMVIDTGRTFAKTPLQKIMASLAGSSHGNATLDELYERFEIGQVSKLPGGNLRMKVKTKESCIRLARTKIQILGGTYTFQEFDILGDKYYIDFINMDSSDDIAVILHRLFLIGCKPVYNTFREVNLATGITSATWRVYFLSSACPDALMVNGAVCDQLIFNNKLHPANGKNAPYQSVRTPYGFRSNHGIDLGSSDSAFPPEVQLPRTTARTSSQRPVSLVTSRPPQTSLQRAVEEGNQRERQLQTRAQHGPLTRTEVMSRPPPIVDALSISTFSDSQGGISPPVSPKPKPMLLEYEGDGFTLAKSKKKRTRSGTDFSSLLVKQQHQPLNGIATANYFQVLQNVGASLTVKDVTAKQSFGPRYQVIPSDVKKPEHLEKSTESAFFLEKHHTHIRKAKTATPIAVVAQSMLDDENTAILSVTTECLTLADTQVESVKKLIAKASNPDHICKKAVDQPMAFNSALITSSRAEIDELAQLHLINRVLSASQPDQDVTFTSKWKKWMKTAVPSTRLDVFKPFGRWWTSTDEINDLARYTRALGLFELTLMSIAPIIFGNDHWIQYVTGMPVAWIPGHHSRYLHPNTLLQLLRSDLGAHCVDQWNQVQWQGDMYDILVQLRTQDGYFPHEASVLRLQSVDGTVSMIAGGLASRC